MKAAVYGGPGKLDLMDVPRPQVAAHEILVRVRVALICGTDVKTFLRGHHSFKPGDILGHEFTGVVEEVGRDVTVCKPGDRVTVAPYVNCGYCFYCRQGLADLCVDKSYVSNGAFAEYVKLTEFHARKGLYVLPPATSLVRGAFTEPLACVLNGVGDTGIEPADVVLIMGAGPMGLLHLLVARLRGATRLVVSEPQAHRRAMASSFGAHAIHPEEVYEVIMAYTEGRGADRVIVANAVPELVAAAMQLVRPGGRVTLFGGFAPGTTVSIDPNRIHYGRVVLVGESGFAPIHFHRAADLLATGHDALPVERLVTHRFTLDDIGQAFEVAASQQAVKVEIDVEGGE
ncbi:alcohol dehydrogenase catalytic domain-containing protein [Geochorda subterranea]|uniref:Alcohol dehydrogenase catalytic domain-containing protein n=1 Tax=Geochorda subterranea TaxID=3109564 RepID=A0ABZ1BPL1_9FIRM|nr:alcohol dehydrogenase catalytic domain-containing protein [Limnochorda sp. LNt]WRP14727.1 alcohol dehydrogenase catalytic domain-containing protein [Limnochorda sp. LNt]